MQGDGFETEFLLPKQQSQLVRAPKTFKPNARLQEKLPTWGALNSPTKQVGNTSGERKPYSVWEDKTIIETIRLAEREGRSFASLVEGLSKRMLRTVESVKERHKRWIRRFAEEDRQKIVDFCKGKTKAYCRDFAVRRKLDDRKGTCELTEILRVVEVDSKNKVVEDEPESLEEQVILLDAEREVIPTVSLGKRALKQMSQVDKIASEDKTASKNQGVSENLRLKQKVQRFREQLGSCEPADVSANVEVLHLLLRQIATYHSVEIGQLVSSLEDGPLCLESLRTKLCLQQS
jgi:hypothetical protein